MGLGFLSKYTALFQLLCWAVFFALWPPARKHLRRPGPYLALLVNLVCALPVLIWNWQHHWITVTHVAGNAGLDKRVEADPAIPGRVSRRRSRLAEPDLLRRHGLGRHRLLAPGPA